MKRWQTTEYFKEHKEDWNNLFTYPITMFQDSHEESPMKRPRYDHAVLAPQWTTKVGDIRASCSVYILKIYLNVLVILDLLWLHKFDPLPKLILERYGIMCLKFNQLYRFVYAFQSLWLILEVEVRSSDDCTKTR
jgi:hypothetical protein